MRFWKRKPRLSPEVQAIITMLDERPAEWRDGPRGPHDRRILGPCGTTIEEFCYEGCMLTVKVGADGLDLESSEQSSLMKAYRRWEAWERASRFAQYRAYEAARKERIRAILLSDTCSA